MTVDHDYGSLALFYCSQIQGDQVFERLGLAMTSAGDDVVMLEARFGRDGEIDCSGKEMAGR